eukprot:scaffold21811_cov17-Tisochrysis_lutea.AAC.4
MVSKVTCLQVHPPDPLPFERSYAHHRAHRRTSHSTIHTSQRTTTTRCCQQQPSSHSTETATITGHQQQPSPHPKIIIAMLTCSQSRPPLRPPALCLLLSTLLALVEAGPALLPGGWCSS